MKAFVYLLCAFTSLGCAILLFRNFLRTRIRLLCWAAAFFFCFALSSSVLFVDLGLLPPEIDLSYYRDGLTLAGLLLFIYGLIWEGGRE